MNRILKLGDCIESISEKKKFESNKIIFLNTSDILDGKIVNQEFVDVNTLPGQAKKSIKNNDILYSEIRPKNKRFMLVNDINEDDFVVSTKLMVLRNKREDILKTRYLYYFLTSTKMIDYLQNLAEGRSGTFPQITFSELKGIDIFIPSIEMQDRFIDAVYSIETRANLLGSINDNLLELLLTSVENKLSDTTLYQKKVSDLNLTISDHVANGSFQALKDNVEIVDEPNYALFLRNTDLKNDLDSDLRYVTEKSYNFLKKSRVYGGEVIISNVGDVGSVHRVPRLNIPMVSGNNIIFISSNEKWLQDYLYVYFLSRFGQHNIDSITSGSAQQKFNKTDFKKLSIPIINSSFVEIFITPLLNTIEANKNEIKVLKKIRNAIINELI